MERVLQGLKRPECLSRFGKASTSSPAASSPLPPALVPASLPPRKASCSPSFLAISRAQTDHLSRNRTQSPSPGHYHPNYHIGKARTDASPTYRTGLTETRHPRLHVPLCLTQITTSYPRHRRSASKPCEAFDDLTKRATVDLSEFERTVEEVEISHPTSLPAPPPTKGLVPLTSQLVWPANFSEPPNCHQTKGQPITAHIPIVNFSKSTERKTLFQTMPSPDYRPVTHLIRTRSPQQLSFAKRPGRKSLALDHMMRTPPQSQVIGLERGWKALESQAGKGVRMETMSPRDDVMYRTNGEYVRNRPRRVMEGNKAQRKSTVVSETEATITFYL